MGSYKRRDGIGRLSRWALVSVILGTVVMSTYGSARQAREHTMDGPDCYFPGCQLPTNTAVKVAPDTVDPFGT